MEEIFLAIQAKLETVTGLATIDMDWGQLDEPQDSYPVLFPCALVDIAEVQWTKTGVKAQPGTVQVKLSIGIDILHDTYSGSRTVAIALARMQPAKLAHEAVNLITGTRFSKLIRINTSYKNMYGIKVVVVTYETNVVEVQV